MCLDAEKVHVTIGNKPALTKIPYPLFPFDASLTGSYGSLCTTLGLTAILCLSEKTDNPALNSSLTFLARSRSTFHSCHDLLSTRLGTGS